MTTRAAPRHVGVIGDLVALRFSLTVYCHVRGCRNYASVDVPALVARLGDGYPVWRYVARLRCKRCGARWPDISIRVAPLDTGTPGPGPLADKAIRKLSFTDKQ